MADPWGIEHSFVNAQNEVQEVSQETIAALREVFGEPGLESGPLVVTTGEELEFGSGEILLEDGGWLSATDADARELPAGYHLLTDGQGGQRSLIVSPGSCHLPDDIRAWGWVSQLYGMRSRRSWGIGDLSDLRRLAEWSRGEGAGFTLINPIAAAAPTRIQQANPYYPTSRRFRNPLYLSIGEVPGAEHVAGELGEMARAGHALNESELIDRDAVWRVKQRALETIWESGAPPEEFESWLQRQPKSLRLFAIWSVLAERHGSRWQDWPAGLHNPAAASVEEIAASEEDRVRFCAWLQWCLSNQLDDAGRHLAIIQDLPIGFDPGGFDAWEWQELLALGTSVGAPPDRFNREGQDWGTPPFIPWRLASEGYRPFIETIRAGMAAGGGLRIDHVMGLWRLWCIPPGAEPSQGSYVRFPADDLLAILALESRRSRALIVGEDLGTVEEGVRETISEREMLSYRLLWFESAPPPEWPVKALAAVTTHDLPTVAGLWGRADLEEQRSLGLVVDEEGMSGIRERLASMGDLSEDSDLEDVIVAAYRQLTTAPSRLLSATLEDAVSALRRPNMPGASGRHVNWRLALPVPLEDLESHPLATRVSGILDDATAGGNGKDPNG